MGHDLKWPPVDVNCNDKTWFTPNGTLPGTCFTKLVLDLYHVHSLDRNEKT